MKNFLKSTALFACIAMLFCACADDATEDVTGGGGDVAALSAPSVKEVTPGKSNIFVEWDVLKGSTANVTSIEWVNTEDSSKGGSHLENVDASVADKTYYYQITTIEAPAGTPVNPETGKVPAVKIPAGEYLVTIKNTNVLTAEESEVDSYTITVYDDTTYAEYCPVAADITYDAATKEVTITWDEVHEDCVGVVVTYYNPYIGAVIAVKSEEVATGSQTVLSDAQAGGAYYYVAAFCPEGSADEVYIDSAKDLTLGVNPGAPVWVSSKGGDGRLLARWSYDEADLETLESSVVRYVSIAGGSAPKSITIAKEDLVYDDKAYEYQYYISDVAVGEYLVSVSNIKVGGFLSSATVSQAPVKVYGAESFVAPKFKDISVDADNNVTIEWGVTEGEEETLKSIEVTYIDADGNEQVAKSEISSTFISSTTLTNAKSGSKIVSAKAYMRYNRGLDLIEYDLDCGSIVIPVDSLPVISDVILGYAEGSKFEVKWESFSGTKYTGINIYYGKADASFPDEYVLESFDETNFDGFTFRNLEVADYKVYVAGVYEDVEYFALEPVEFTTYGVETYKDGVMPTPTITTADNVVSVQWSTEGVSEDLSSVTIIYNNEIEGPTSIDTSADELAEATTFAYEYGVTTEIQYSFQFQPEGGEGAVLITPEANTAAIPEQAPASPAALTVGDYGFGAEGMYVNVSWTAPDVTKDIAKYYFYYSTDGEFPTDAEGIEIADAATASYKWVPETAGEYTLFVKSSTAAGTLSTDYTSVAALAYDANYFTAENLPTADVEYNNSKVVITWSDVNKYLTSVDVVYGTDDTTNAGVEITEGAITEFTYDETFDKKISFKATFAPGAEGSVVVDGGDKTFEIAATDIALVGSTYEIKTSLGLAAFADIVSGTKTYLNDATTEGFDAVNITAAVPTASAKLTKDLDLSDICNAEVGSWVPMASFDGTFDGDGKTISNLYISREGKTDNALIAVATANAVIKNVIMKDVNAVGNKSTASLVGSLNGATIQGCGVTGASTFEGGAYTAGIAGYSKGGLIESCYTEASVTITGTIEEKDTANGSAGGMLGQATESTKVVDCHNAAKVTGTRSAGGLVGYSNNVIMVASSNSGVVSGFNTGGLGGRFIGGVVNIIGCYNTGEVKNTGSQTAGILGVSNSTVTMAGVYNTGDVTGATTQTGAFTGYAIDGFTFNDCYFIPATNVSWAAVSADAGNPAGVTTAADAAALNAAVAAMNQAIADAGYDYQYADGADGALPTISLVGDGGNAGGNISDLEDGDKYQ